MFLLGILKLKMKMIPGKQALYEDLFMLSNLICTLCRFSARVDFGPIFKYKKGIVKDILSQGHKKAQLVLSHPVMETYLYLQSSVHMTFAFRVGKNLAKFEFQL